MVYYDTDTRLQLAREHADRLATLLADYSSGTTAGSDRETSWSTA